MFRALSAARRLPISTTHAPFRSLRISPLAAPRALPAQRVPCRGFAADIDSRPPKPKATTPLRRAAAASLPIRSNPTPTRSTIQPVFTLTTAERFILPRLRPVLPSSAVQLHESWWVPKWGAEGKEGEVFVFGNGSIVCWGLGEAEAEGFAKEVLAKSNAAVQSLKESETEDLEFVTDPSE